MQKEIKREYWPDVVSLSEEYQINSKGKRDGWYKYYFPNGNVVIECTHKNGILDGIYKSYSSNGIYKWCWSNGQFNFMDQYKKGNIHGIEILFK